MALIYTKLAEKTTVLAPGEGGGRKLDFDAWTEIRYGLFCSAVSASGSNTDNTSESLVPANLTEHVTFGLKDDDQTTFPGEAGSLFIGIREGDAANVQSSVNTGIGAAGGNWRPVGYHGATEVLGGSIALSMRMGAATASAASAYASYLGVKIVINDLGLSTQTLTFNVAGNPSVAGTDYSETALLTLLQNSFGGAGTTIAWNDGAAARAIPDCLWVRTPLLSNSIRISCIRAVRYAP